LIEYRVLKLICSGYGLAKEVVKGYFSKYGEAISLQAIERILAKLRVKGLVNGKHSGRALAYEETQLGKTLTC
jgi:hypothetical protein